MDIIEISLKCIWTPRSDFIGYLNVFVLLQDITLWLTSPWLLALTVPECMAHRYSKAPRASPSGSSWTSRSPTLSGLHSMIQMMFSLYLRVSEFFMYFVFSSFISLTNYIFLSDVYRDLCDSVPWLKWKKRLPKVTKFSIHKLV